MATRRKINWLKTILVLILVVAAGVICFLVWKAYFSGEKPSEGSSEDSSAIVDDKTKEKEKEEKKEEAKTDGDEKEKVPQYDGDDPNEKAELTGVITYAGIVSQNLTIRVNIDQYVSNGSCTLALRREGMTVYSTEVPIIDSASTSTCEGFDVSLKGLDPGPTVIIIYLNGDGKTGELTHEVEL